jgi:hypothetical protein
LSAFARIIWELLRDAGVPIPSGQNRKTTGIGHLGKNLVEEQVSYVRKKRRSNMTAEGLPKTSGSVSPTGSISSMALKRADRKPESPFYAPDHPPQRKTETPRRIEGTSRQPGAIAPPEYQTNGKKEGGEEREE